MGDGVGCGWWWFSYWVIRWVMAVGSVSSVYGMLLGEFWSQLSQFGPMLGYQFDLVIFWVSRWIVRYGVLVYDARMCCDMSKLLLLRYGVSCQFGWCSSR